MEINMSTYNQRRYLNMCVLYCASVITEKLTPYSCFVAISFFLSQGSDLLKAQENRDMVQLVCSNLGSKHDLWHVTVIGITLK